MDKQLQARLVSIVASLVFSTLGIALDDKCGTIQTDWLALYFRNGTTIVHLLD